MKAKKVFDFLWERLIPSRGATIVFIIFYIFIAGMVVLHDYYKSNQLYFVVNMEASNPGGAEVFYDVGQGYSKQHGYSIAINTAKFKSQKYVFPLIAKKIKSIRFDPTNTADVVRIKDVRVENGFGRIIRKFQPHAFQAVQQISKIDYLGDNTLIVQTTENANDPILSLENSSFEQQIELSSCLVNCRWMLIELALLSFLCLIGINYFTRCNECAIGIVQSFTAYVLAHKKSSIVFMAFIATILSCYPIVFFHMTFVAPGGGCLYENPYYLPGYLTDVLNLGNPRGSDVGATLWSVVPNSVVQYSAIMRYLEFPFWNRYIAGGVPLFAQGQSFIGDVLHWIPIMFGGNAIGWDIKFVLSKAIFAAGMGLLIFRLTHHFLASLLIVFSSCFLGFFAWRFNHPSFFVLTYAPWVVLQWDRLGELFVSLRPQLRSCVIQGLFLILIAWLQLNSGSPKESFIIACFMYALGITFFIEQVRHRRGWLQSILIAIGFCVVIVMITSFHWLLFLDALSKSFTYGDTSGVNDFFPLWKIATFFDNYFFQRVSGNVIAPSTNLFVLLGLCSAVTALRKNKSIKFYSIWLLFVLAMFIVYGIIPKIFLISIPLINKVQHLSDAVCMPMMILSLILAGFGVQHYLDAEAKTKKIILALCLSIFVGIVAVYSLDVLEVIGFADDFIFFTIAFFTIIFFGVLMLYRQIKLGVWSSVSVSILLCCFLLLHIRHGMHLMIGIPIIDNYLMTVEKRPDYLKRSSAIDYINNQIKERMEPSRVVGEDRVLFPGTNSIFGIEGLVSVEPLRNSYYENLLGLLDYPEIAGWGWLRLIKNDQISSRSAALDMLNVGYIAATPGTKMPQDMKLVHSSDLDVWQRNTVWPRAFFVNQVVEVRKASDILVVLAKKPHVPFAAVESQLIPPWIPNNINGVSLIAPATQYSLTNNSTKFSVDATGAGIIVLGETYYPEDFVVTLNGKRVDYIRVNNAFKGIWVTQAGKYDVVFTYRPAKLYQALMISLCGLLFLPIFVIVFLRLKSNKK